jgi:transcriptional regulator with XRE-family HTH domain
VKDREKRSTRLKELIERANLTQRQLSDQINVTERNINDWIRGVSVPRLDRAALLARALGVSFKQLCDALGIPIKDIPDDMQESQSAETADDNLDADRN